ncbi:MAG: DUF1294 domain-containing protein [Bacteroidales bacterium]|nr:DUF1294 domain-containing protein [Bacteroidales bacterium]
MLYYFLIINVVAAVVFAGDKYCSKHNAKRVPESILHLLEISGGVFCILFLMYTIRHKNRKWSYYVFTWIAALAWIVCAYLVFF